MAERFKVSNPNHVIPPKALGALNLVDIHARSSPDKEVCGFIVGKRLFQATNVADVPETSFHFDAKSFKLLNEYIADGKRPIIYHSHVHPDSLDDFSPSDFTNMQADGELPWLVCKVSDGDRGSIFNYFDPLIVTGYEEREWRWSCVNCYTLVRDWLWIEMGIKLDPFSLTSETAWKDPNWNEFEENLGKQGFTMVDAPPDIKDVKTGDLILSRAGRAINPNHIAVVTSASRNEILHQLQDAYSAIVPYSESRQKATVGVYRHESLMGGK